MSNGSFVFNELITDDLEAAKRFYGELLGWTFTEAKTVTGEMYINAFKDKKPVAGMMLKEGNVADDVPLCWDPYIGVDDINISMEKVKELGGTVIVPITEIPMAGYFCVIKDTSGVSLNLFSSFKY